MNLLFKNLVDILNTKHRRLYIGGLALILCALTPDKIKSAELPSVDGLQFQTSGANRCANIGDWYTTDGRGTTPNCTSEATTSRDKIHRFNIDITQEMLDAAGGIVDIVVIDAESNGGGSIVDEVFGAADPTRFQLYDSNNSLLDSKTTASGSPNGTNLVFSVNSPGTYQLTSETGARLINRDSRPGLNNDDNSFRLQIPDAGTSPELQSLIGQFQGTMQQNTGADISFDAFFLVGPGVDALELRNFDLDGNGNNVGLAYSNPNGANVGSPTVSNNGVWNGGGTLNTGGDNFPINNAASNNFADAGIWKIDVNDLNSNNQLILEANTGDGDRLVVYDNIPPRAGNFTITPDTTRTVRSGQSIDHPFTVTNLFGTTDIINLSLSGTNADYTVQLLDANTNQVLTDTDGDGSLDTGILDPNRAIDLILRVTHNGSNSSPDDATQIDAVSFMDTKVDSANNITRSITKTTIFDTLATVPTPNPEYTKGCGTGVKIALILDASGSINFARNNGGVQQVRNGITAFINEINNIAPGTEIGIVEFAYGSDTPVDFTAVNSTSITNTFEPYINSQYYNGRVGQLTNWEAAFRLNNRRLNNNTPAMVNPLLLDADAVIFVTDGNPNSYINNSNSLSDDRFNDRAFNVNEAVEWTNFLKQGRAGKPEGTHIYGFGIVGSSTDNPVENFFPITDGASSTQFVTNPDGTDNAESADYAFVNQFAEFGNGLIDLVGGICGKRPNVSLVKRITAINPRQFSNERRRNFENYYVDVRPNDDPDNAPSDNINNWPGNLTSPNEGTEEVKDYLRGEVFDLVVPDDEVEYAIYFLSSGRQTANDVLICDLLPENSEFVVDSFSPRSTDPRASSQNGLLGAGRGILLEFNNQTQSLTSVSDDDPGYYFPPGVDPAGTFPDVKCGNHTTPNNDPDRPNLSNDSGAVVVNVGNLPNANAPGSPINSYGSIRFRVRIK